jgi:hypothetical protein
MKKIFQSIALLSTVVVLLSSCLKSKDLIGPDADNSAGAIIEFSNPAPIASSSATASVPVARYELTLPKGDASPLKFRVSYVGTGKPAPTDVTVGLAVDPAALNTHNIQSNRRYNIIPADWYTMPATVVIPSGQTGVDVQVPVNTNNFLTGQTYAIPLKITSASAGTISGNFGTIIVAIAPEQG